MDIVFKCTNCEQEMAVDATGAGSEIECPSCGTVLTVPEPTMQEVEESISTPPPTPPAREEKHFAVPTHSAPAEALIKKAQPTLDVVARGADKLIRVKTIKHGDCVEVGKDRFDEIVTAALQNIGQENIISITPVTYSHTDIATRQLMSDFAVMIVFKG